MGSSISAAQQSRPADFSIDQAFAAPRNGATPAASSAGEIEDAPSSRAETSKVTAPASETNQSSFFSSAFAAIGNVIKPVSTQTATPAGSNGAPNAEIAPAASASTPAVAPGTAIEQKQAAATTQQADSEQPFITTDDDKPSADAVAAAAQQDQNTATTSVRDAFNKAGLGGNIDQSALTAPAMDVTRTPAPTATGESGDASSDDAPSADAVAAAAQQDQNTATTSVREAFNKAGLAGNIDQSALPTLSIEVTRTPAA